MQLKKLKNNMAMMLLYWIRFFQGAPHDAKPLWFLGQSILILSQADVAYFIGDWKKYRGCKAENMLAHEYGIKTIEE